MRLNKESLDYSIYNLGLEETLTKFKISLSKVETILFSPSTKNRLKSYNPAPRKTEKPWVRSKDFDKLCEVLRKNFDKILRDNHVKNYWIIDKLSLSFYDKAIDGILSCLLDPNFTYKGEEETLAFINLNIRKALKRHKLRDYRTPQMIDLVTSGDTHATEPDIESLLIHFGYSQQEITRLSKRGDSNISRSIRIIKKEHAYN